MKKLYPFLVCSLFLAAGCSKDFLKSYEDRIEGTWQLVDVDRQGFGGSISNLPFQDGEFTFSEGGGFTYTNGAGNVYKGSWDIDRDWIRDDERIRSLSIVAVDFNSQEVRSENFDEMRFTGTNRFNAYIYSGAHTYVFRFRR